jgi:hypothetical protein
MNTFSKLSSNALARLQGVAPGFKTIYLRRCVAFFFSAFMFFGVLQIGVRWESKQYEGTFLLLDRSGVRHYGSLAENWLGDFVLLDKDGGVVLTFSKSSITYLHPLVSQTAPVTFPWRLTLFFLLSWIMGYAAWVGSMRSTFYWGRKAIKK